MPHLQVNSRPSSEDGAAGDAERQGEESESSWGELQHAGGQGAAEREFGEGGYARSDGEGGAEGDHVDTEGANGAIQGGAQGQGQGQDQQGSATVSPGAGVAGREEEERGGGRRHGEEQVAAAELRLPTATENDDADVVMVSPSGGRAMSDGETGNGGADDGSTVGSTEEDEGAAADVGAVTRSPNLGALMTMLVVSLRMQRLVHWVVRKRCLDGLSGGNLVDLLAALEVKEALST